jgi:hypothetical protein
MDPSDVQFLVMVSAWRRERGFDDSDGPGVVGGVVGHGGGGGGGGRASFVGGGGGSCWATRGSGGCGGGASSTIRCAVRKRPLLPKEASRKVFDVVSCSLQGGSRGPTALL